MSRITRNVRRLFWLSVMALLPFIALAFHPEGLAEVWFLLGSAITLACVLMFSRLFDKPFVEAADTGPREKLRTEMRNRRIRSGIIAMLAALILQVDVGHASKTVFTTGRSITQHFSTFAPSFQSLLCVANSQDNPPLLVTNDMTRREYDTAVGEIRQRLDQEQTLFCLKFLVVAAVLGAIFTLLRRNRRIDEIHDSLHLGSTFLWAAVLASAVIDARIHFNSKMLETLGCWIYLVEGKSNSILLWERYLRAGHVFFELPTYALLKSYPYLLTILLFTAILYYTLIIAEEERRVARYCAIATMISLWCTGVSYHGESLVWIIHSVVWGSAGCIALLQMSWLPPEGQELTPNPTLQIPPAQTT